MSCGPTDVQAILNYILPSPDGEALWSCVLRPAPPKPWTNAVGDPQSVVIHDARGRQDEFSLDRSGFEFLRHPSTMAEFFDERTVRTLYYSEVEQLLRKHTGAKQVIITGHTLRRSHRGSHTDFLNVSGPAYSIHGDRTLDSAIMHARQIVGRNIDRLLKGRYRILNVWRPIGGPVYDEPLALIDYRTIDIARDLVSLVVKYAGHDIETFAAFYNEKHKWYYLKEQAPEEVTLIKCYDSLTDGTARLSLHSAFHDHTSTPDVPPRRSIEVRALVFDDE